MEKVKQFFSKKIAIRWMLLLTFVGIYTGGGTETKEAFLTAISDAYVQVTVFVALTLFIFYGLESLLKIDTEKFLKKHKKYQVPIATVLGALPGCGGAIMVMTQYSMGRLGFGAVVAVLTSTMGDAAFLLLSQKPDAALVIFSISIAVGIIFGYLVEFIHGHDFLHMSKKGLPKNFGTFYKYGIWKHPWTILLIPGLIVGLFTAFQKVEIIDNLIAQIGIPDFSLWLGVAGAILSFLLWVFNPTAGSAASNFFECKSRGDVMEKVTADTAFVTTWVIVGYLAFELGVIWTGFDFQALFKTYAAFVPLMATLIGFLPGCGPQVLVTTMYLQGFVPFSAQISNAISNDGDALFPAIAISPKASIVATLYTAIPALLVGYGYYFLFELA